METHVIRLLCEAYDSLEEAYNETEALPLKSDISGLLERTRAVTEEATKGEAA